MQQAQSARTKLAFTPKEKRNFSLNHKVGCSQNDGDVGDAGCELQRMRIDNSRYLYDRCPKQVIETFEATRDNSICKLTCINDFYNPALTLE